MVFTIEPHPLLDARAFVTTLPMPLGELGSPAAIIAMLALEAVVPLHSDDSVREAVRALLRHGGFKPTGRSKPASEYLLRAAGEQKLASINAAVDICNVVSLHSGLPISVIDLDRAREPFRVALAAPKSEYVFNPAGQSIDLGGLLCLFDTDGPCACAVKDSQRTKTSEHTRRTLSIIWGTSALPGRCEEAMKWYGALLGTVGAGIERMTPSAAE